MLYTVIIFENAIRGVFDEDHECASYIRSILSQENIYDDELQEALEDADTVDELVGVAEEFNLDIQIYRVEGNEEVKEWSL